MLFRLLTVILLALSAATHAQNASVDALIAEARRQYNSSFPQSLATATNARGQAIKSQYIPGIIAATCVISQIQSNTNHCQEAIDALYKLPATTGPGTQALLSSAKGICWGNRGNFDSARAYHEKALTLSLVAHDSALYVRECVSLGKTLIKTGRRDQALEYYQKALSVCERRNDSEGAAWCSELLSNIYYAQKLFDKAIFYLDRSNALFKSLGNRNGLSAIALNKGNIYYMDAKDDSATMCYNEALAQFSALGDSSGMAICYSNISRIYLDDGKPEQSADYAFKALSAIRPGNYITVEAGTYQQLADIYGELKQYDKAIRYAQQALTAARAGDNKEIVKDTYKTLSELYFLMRKPDMALMNLLAAYRIKDSIQPVAFSRQLADMEARYEAEKKENEIRILKQQGQINTLKMEEQNNRLQKQRYLLLLLAIGIVGLLISTYFYIARRRLQEHIEQQNIIRETEEKERMRIAKDIHDELGSGLSKIKFLSELAPEQAGYGGQVHGSLVSIADTSRSLIDNMRDLVWAMNPDNTTLSTLVARIREYSYDYLEDMPIELRIDFPEQVSDQKISKEMTRNVYMIVKEVLQNIVKHAQATEVQMRLEITSQFRLEISDNGRGYDPALYTDGNGLRNITARSQALGATLNITTSPGKGCIMALVFAIEGMA